MSVLKRMTLSTPPCVADLSIEEENEKKDVERDMQNLDLNVKINQQVGLIRPSAAGFLSPQQATKADKAPPLSSSSTEEKKKRT